MSNKYANIQSDVLEAALRRLRGLSEQCFDEGRWFLADEFNRSIEALEAELDRRSTALLRTADRDAVQPSNE